MPVMLRQQHIFTAKRDQQKKKTNMIKSIPVRVIRTDRNIYYSESITSRKGGDAHMDKSERLILIAVSVRTMKTSSTATGHSSSTTRIRSVRIKSG